MRHGLDGVGILQHFWKETKKKEDSGAVSSHSPKRQSHDTNQSSQLAAAPEPQWDGGIPTDFLETCFRMSEMERLPYDEMQCRKTSTSSTLVYRELVSGATSPFLQTSLVK